MNILDRSEIISKWWKNELNNKHDGDARALSARLRRATTFLEALSESSVAELGQSLGLGFNPEKLGLLVLTLAHVKENHSSPLARFFGPPKKGEDPVLSKTRLMKIMREEPGLELAIQLRRALPLVGNTCNVNRLGLDLLFWDDKTRARWWFDYYGGQAPAEKSETGDQSTKKNEEAAS